MVFFIAFLLSYFIGRQLFGGQKSWRGPRPDPAQERQARFFIEQYLYENPDSPMTRDFPEIARKNDAFRLAAHLDRRLAEGKISQAQYERFMDLALELLGDLPEDLLKPTNEKK